MAKSQLRIVTPDQVLPKVMPVRRKNADYRTREYLTEIEVEKVMKAAKSNRHGQRDSTLILIKYRHGLRVSELVALQWSDIEFETGTMHVGRVKGGVTRTHPLLGDEMRALRALKRDANTPFVFVTERGGPFTVSAVQKMVATAGVNAGLPFQIHPHMLRHATGFALANKGVDTRTLQGYLGHRSIQSTVIYTELAPGRFKNIWR